MCNFLGSTFEICQEPNPSSPLGHPGTHKSHALGGSTLAASSRVPRNLTSLCGRLSTQEPSHHFYNTRHIGSLLCSESCNGFCSAHGKCPSPTRAPLASRDLPPLPSLATPATLL